MREPRREERWEPAEIKVRGKGGGKGNVAGSATPSNLHHNSSSIHVKIVLSVQPTMTRMLQGLHQTTRRRRRSR